MTPEGLWISSYLHAGRLLRRYFNRVRFRHVPIDGKLHWVDPDGQLYFPFIPQHSEEMGNTPAERAYIRAIGQIPHEIGTTLLQYKTSYWEALRLASRLPSAGELLVSNPQLFWLWLRDLHSAGRSSTSLKLQILRGNLEHPQHIQMSMLGINSKKF